MIDSSAESGRAGRARRAAREGYRFTRCPRSAARSTTATPSVRVIIDPIDGSLNAKRGAAPPRAVDRGRRRRDDGRRRVRLRLRLRRRARSGGRAAARARGWTASGSIRRSASAAARDGRLELLGIESADPRWVAASIDALVGTAYRLRALGTIASSLCQVAAARFDGMVSLRNCRGRRRRRRAADRPRGRRARQLPALRGPARRAARCDPGSPVIAARTPETLAELEGIPA